MKCIACQHEGDFHKLIFMTKRTKQESGILIKETHIDGTYNLDFKMVDLNACPSCGTVRMDRTVK